MAAVLFKSDWPAKILRYCLGPLTRHTTYEAEIVDVILALQLIGKERGGCMVSIKLDNQAVIQALNSREAKPGSSLLDLVHAHCNRLAGHRSHLLEMRASHGCTHTPMHGGIRWTETDPRHSLSHTRVDG